MPGSIVRVLRFLLYFSQERRSLSICSYTGAVICHSIYVYTFPGNICRTRITQNKFKHVLSTNAIVGNYTLRCALFFYVT